MSDYFIILFFVLLASLIKGSTGFGFMLTCLPPLLFFYSPKEVLPVMVMCNCISSTIIVSQKKEAKLLTPTFYQLILYGGLFSLVGVIIYKYLNEQILLISTSIFLIVFTSLSLFGFTGTIPLTRKSCRLAGGILGVLTGTAGIGGPLLAIFLHATKVQNQVFREVFAWFSLISTSITTLGYLFVDALTTEHLKLTAMFVPFLFLGAYLGKKVNHLLPAAQFRKLVIMLTLISSVLIFTRSLDLI